MSDRIYLLGLGTLLAINLISLVLLVTTRHPAFFVSWVASSVPGIFIWFQYSAWKLLK